MESIPDMMSRAIVIRMAAMMLSSFMGGLGGVGLSQILGLSGFEEVEDMIGHADLGEHLAAMSQLGAITGFIKAR